MADDYVYDSFGGPTLMLRPEELDRLDASQIEPSESPSLAQDVERCRRLEESIHGTINAIKANAPSLPYQASSTSYHHHQPPQQHAFATSPETITNSRPFAAKNVALTPPSSNDKPQLAFHQEFPPLHGQILDNLGPQGQRESETQAQAERNHRMYMEKLQNDIDELMKQHANVIKLKSEVEKGLQLELEVTRKDLRREREARETEKERYSRQIRELKDRIRSLETRLDEARDHRGGRRPRAVSFAGDHDSFGRGGAMTRGEYERKLADMQREHDAKIANLVRQFDREKAAALEILKSKVKAEVSLLIPRIKDKCQRVYAERFQSLRDSLASKFRQHYEDKVRMIREEAASERRMWQRQAREQIERERDEMEQKVKAKYELRLMDMKNECERRILQRLREGGSDGGGGGGGSSSGGGRPRRARGELYDHPDPYCDRYYGSDSEDSFL